MVHALRPLFLMALFLAAGIGMSGCASIVSGTSQELTFESQPEGATVSLDGNVLGKSPVTTTVKRERKRIVSFSKDGYQTQTMQLKTALNGWFWGNFAFSWFGPLSSTTDGVSGAVHEYIPGRYYVTLTPEVTAGISAAPATVIIGENAKIKEFIVLEYSNIAKDLAKGSGEYLSALMVLLGIRQDFRPAAIAKIKANAAVYNDIPSFADSVIEIASHYK